MAYDEQFAARVRGALAGESEVREVKMFGGLAFMVDGAMAVCVSTGGGALLVRVSPARDAELVRAAGARRAEMGAGRSMGEGWIAVDDAAVAGDGLRSWLDAALEREGRRGEGG
ncbi:TfoX/Sxy family protein [Nocardioides sp. ChNu-153]|uniref:TfoX/Sxy family protein n=1 Tax=unclassified Nocardioides TaxID=2615069 RepID=UPI002404AD83|nr:MULTISPECIES: TfoX/Sxy family protein [unclassified Nocardioides]MDF9716319.1 TfoX/Sxy family protein [Nocardioides sp. ChNu-99]MDN7122719.1 TfoX/Sxy family protein [Nocardioides sp. ChNu-153]